MTVLALLPWEMGRVPHCHRGEPQRSLDGGHLSPHSMLLLVIGDCSLMLPEEAARCP